MTGWIPNPYAIALIAIAAVIGLVAVPAAWRRRRLPGGIALLTLSLATLEWTLGYGLELGAPTLSAKLLLTNLEYIGIATIPGAWLVFALQYTQHGKWVNARRLVALAVVPAITLVLLWTNALHGFMQQNIALDTTGPFAAISKTFGPWFWVHYAYTVFLLFIGSVLLLQHLVSTTRSHRGQAVSLLIAVAPPWIANVFHLARIYPIHRLDLTPIAFGVSVLALTVAIYRYRLLELIPLAVNVAVREIGVGLIIADAKENIVSLNPAAERMVGASSNALIGQTVPEVIPPLAATKPPHATEWHVQPEKRGLSLELQQWPLTDRAGNALGQAITLHDITQQKEAELAFATSNDRMVRLHEASHRLATLESEHEILAYVVRTCEQELPFVTPIVYVATGDTLHPATDTHASEQATSPILVEGTGPVAAAYRSRTLVRPTSSDRTLYVPIPEVGVLVARIEGPGSLSEEDGRWIELLLQHVSEDVKRVRLRQKLQEQARRDVLTGVFNRRHLLDAIRTEGARASRSKHRLAFVMLDVNGFKAVNDRLGHHVGDRVLAEIGQFLLQQVREYDVVIRYGGDEFLLILPETGDEADDIVERIRQTFETWADNANWLTVPLSLATGIARWDPQAPISWERAVRESDRAMYEDKKRR